MKISLRTIKIVSSYRSLLYPIVLSLGHTLRIVINRSKEMKQVGKKLESDKAYERGMRDFAHATDDFATIPETLDKLFKQRDGGIKMGSLRGRVRRRR